jgi:hypothetical protein
MAVAALPVAYVAEVRAPAHAPSVAETPDTALVDLAKDILDLPGTRSTTRAGAAPVVVESVHAGAEIPTARTLARGSWGELRADAGTRIEVSAHGSTIDIRATPGLTVDANYVPDFRVARMTYDVHTRTFEVDANGPGPDFVYRRAATWIANHSLVDLLPPELRAPGPQGSSALSRAVLVLDRVTGGDGPSPASAASDLVAPSGSISLYAPNEIRHQLDNGMLAIIPAHTTFHVSARMTGPVGQPVLASGNIHISGQGVTVRQTTGTFASLNGIVIRGAALGPGGQIALEYDLLAERAIDGGVGLVRLLAALAGAHNGDPSGLVALHQPQPPARLNSIRAEVDAELQSRLRPALIDLVHENDGAIPGFSLSAILGLGAF